MTATVVVVTPASALPPSTKAPVTTGVQTRLAWSRCYRDVTAETGAAYQCATAQVPLDYDSPNGAAVQLAVVRIPAAGSGEQDRIDLPQPGWTRRFWRRLRARLRTFRRDLLGT